MSGGCGLISGWGYCFFLYFCSCGVMGFMFVLDLRGCLDLLINIDYFLGLLSIV